MASIRVLYFAGLRDAVGLAEESIELTPRVGFTVGELCTHLAERHGAYAERRAHVRVARNEEFAEAGDALADGDVLALIPPVAGG